MIPATLIDGLEIKLRQLAAQVARQRAQYEAVVAEKENLQRDLDRQRGVVSSLRDKLERTQLQTVGDGTPAAPAGEAPAADAAQRETIEYCLREIDRCLDWLHRN